MSLPVAERWFATEQLANGITRIWEPHVDDWLRANMFLIRGRDGDLLVDTGCGIAPLVPELERLGRDPSHPLLVVATHAHLDHIGGLHEFDARLAHPAEAAELADPSPPVALTAERWDPDVLADLSSLWRVPDVLVDAAPASGFDPATHKLRPAPPTRLVGDGDVLELGDRSFEVLHLPGHSPGSIGLWEAATAILIAGDAVYDDDLIDVLPDSDIGSYVVTMRRLRELPARIVHGGHGDSFDGARLVEVVDGYLELRS